jgi:coenzyme F420 biosynthesis associated uncharacterized protein
VGSDPALELDWSLGSRAALLADWEAAIRAGRLVAGAGPVVSAAERTELRTDLARAVEEAEALVADFAGLEVAGFRSRAWVMGRGGWIRQNINGLQRLMEPLADRILAKKPGGTDKDMPVATRKLLAYQVGGLLGYVSRRVLGQFDIFVPPDDDGLIYFVGPNLIDVERSFALPPRDFRMWVAIHEVTHRVQFSVAPWLRTEIRGMVDRYLDSVSLDPKELFEQLSRALEGVRGGGPDEPGGILRLLTPEQRPLFEQTQAMMSLLEGHASYVMNRVAEDVVDDLPRLRAALAKRRAVGGLEKRLQHAIGFDQKVAQYDAGERFVAHVIDRAGMSGFNLIWQGPEMLPRPEEIGDPDRWVARVPG